MPCSRSCVAHQLPELCLVPVARPAAGSGFDLKGPESVLQVRPAALLRSAPFCLQCFCVQR